MTKSLFLSLSLLALLSPAGLTAQRNTNPLQPTPLDILKPVDSFSSTYNPQNTPLTCEILLSQNMVYSSGQTEDYCKKARDNCYTTGLIRQLIAHTNSNNPLPKDLTIGHLKKVLNAAAALEEIGLVGCRLALRSTQTSVMNPDTTNLESAAGYYK